MIVTTSLTASSPREPWFRHHPGVALAVAGALYVLVLLLRVLAGQPADTYSMLFALPVALIAIAFGLRAGVAGALVAVALIVVWIVVKDVTLSPSGWMSRVLPLLLLGVLLGDASDRLRRSEAEKRRLESAALLYRQAIEINDSIVQGMAAARWSLEAGRVDAGLQTLEQTLTEAQELVSGLIGRAGMGAGEATGIAPVAPLSPGAEGAGPAR
ncbi:hypothetical protein AB0E63_45935 [Kribbella sp. NPDC026596]|uniref:hypothetical protein n=1 Tax=Kribbella sp. NPDC026596 TaxID=3155122 RepID=UPI003401E985